MTSPTPSRRRQRSVRVTVAVALLALGTLGVAVALSLATVPALSVASVGAVLTGWLAARIVYTELVQSRRERARERAAQARSYRALFVERSTEHAAFASAMTDRLVARDREIRELEGTLRLSEGRADDAEMRVRREARRVVETQRRVAELEQVLALRTAALAAVPGGRGAAGPDTDLDSDLDAVDLDTVVDLLAWEDRTQQLLAADQPRRKHA